MMKIGKTFLTKIFWVEILPTKPKISGEIPRFKKSFGNCQGKCSSQGSPNTSVEIPFQHLFWGKCHWGFLYFCSFIMEIPSPLVEKNISGEIPEFLKKNKNHQNSAESGRELSRVSERTAESGRSFKNPKNLKVFKWNCPFCFWGFQKSGLGLNQLNLGDTSNQAKSNLSF